MNIRTFVAREILDSRGYPSLEVDVHLDNGLWERASVPSGASKGLHEALELRDRQRERYQGQGLKKACDLVLGKIAPALNHLDPTDLKRIDQTLIELDGTDNKRGLGANTTLAVSLACAKAGARLRDKALYQHLDEIYRVTKQLKIPTPLMNVINGGRHANNNLAIQEFMIVPEQAPSFKEALRMGSETFHALKNIFKNRGDSVAVGDEGGFSPTKIKNPEEAIESLLLAIEQAGHKDKIRVSLDLAASEFCGKDGKYKIFPDKAAVTARGIIDLLKTWTATYPLASLEDSLGQDDWQGWADLTRTLGSAVLLVGDDLFVTNPQRFKRGIDNKIANAILIKPNQIGTITETAQVIALAKQHGYATIASHRSGETEDTALAHIAVGLGTDGIKTGSLSRSERLAKYNELLRIEENLGQDCYVGGLRLANKDKQHAISKT